MAPSSSFVIAACSADYWKRQLTLEETENRLCWISVLNSYVYCLCALEIMLILLGTGGYTEMSGIGTRHSFLVEHPQQHLLKLRVHTIRYFLLIQFNSALQISAAEIQE